MHLAKKYLLSFFMVLSLGILQFNMITGIKPVSADSTLLSGQNLLTESAGSSYGGKPLDMKIVILNLIKTALSLIAILLVVLLIIAGFKYMTSGGNETQIKEAMGQIQALAIGLLIILSSWGITYYILRVLVCETTTTGTACSFW